MQRLQTLIEGMRESWTYTMFWQFSYNNSHGVAVLGWGEGFYKDERDKLLLAPRSLSPPSPKQASEDWYHKEQLARKKGEDNLARGALKRKSKIHEASSKKDTLKARAQFAKTATKGSEMVGNLNTSSALSAFDKMEEKGITLFHQK
ncbi:hypothetical protein FF2_014255 [Malus domestica]|uniref:Transcription factor MYC/MYB N-terminal domain-containing protein n=1 Tax=Malus domestica TaxID=3750 RepID=A0A498HZT7_MALDO|nr:hypothetical protein DVH24_019764 [Malus domestica]